jgi:tetratricopeptide (TPR) repeat protein
VIAGQAAGVDLAPTCLDLLGVGGADALSGRSLLPAILGLPDADAAAAYVETETSFHGFGLAPLAGLSTPAYKYISAPRPELYDLGQDPGETRDLFAERRDVARDLARRLEQLRGPPSLPTLADPDALGEVDRAQLEALGYVFGGAERITLADPKDVVAQASELRGQLSGHISRGEFDMVLELAEQLLALFPGDASAMWAQGRALLAVGRVDDAVGVLRQAVRLRTDRPEPAVDLAHALRLAGDSAAALDSYDLALAADPNHVMALLEGAQLAYEAGQLQRSVDYAERALATGLLGPELAAQTRASADAITALMR